MKKLIIYFLLLLALPTSLLGQTTVTVGTSGVDYLTLKEAFDDINAGGIKGVIILQIIDNTSETATAMLNASGAGAASYTSILIYPTGSGYTIGGSVNGPLIDLNGADNVTIDGRVNATGSAKDLTITNTSTSNTSGTSTIRFVNDATNNTIKYCTIKGSSTATTGGILFFSTTTGTTGNDGNIIDNNNITNSADANRPLNVIYSAGTAAKENSGNTISNNNIYDFLNKGTTSNGINLDANTTTWTISGNSFYETTSFVPTASVAYNAMQINNTGTNYSITGNYIGGQAALCGGSAWTKTNPSDNIFYAINLNVGTGTASSIQNNIIQNFTWSNSGSATWTGINITGGAVNIGTTTGNTIGAASGTGSILVTGGATNTNVYGINIASGGTVDCQNNIIGSITTANASASNATNLYGINKTPTAGTTTINNNSIGSTTTANSLNASSTSTSNAQSVFGISNAGTADVTLRGNTVANLMNGTTNTSGNVIGVYFNGSTGTNAVRENFIHSLTTASASNTALIYGIKIVAGATTYFNNIISLGGNTQSSIYGIYESGGGSNNNNIYFNSIYIGGNPTSGNNNSYALFNNANTNVRDFRNNIFYNARSNNGATGKHYATYVNATGGTITCDYNDYYVTGTDGVLGYYGGDKTVLPIATGQDVNSLAVDPLFANPGGTSAGDYLPSKTSLIGVSGTGISTDFNGAARGVPPTMGAFEIGACTNPTSGGTITTAQNGCSPFDPAAFTSTLPASGQIGGSLEYKWQQSITSSTTGFSDITGSNSLTYDPGSLTQTTWYKRVAIVSCKSGDWTGAAESNVLEVTVNQLPVANAITGANAVCNGNSLSLTSNATGTPTLTYLWTSSNTAVATINNSGVVTTISPGTTNVTYKVTDGSSSACQATSAIYPVTVNSLPVANPISGGNSVCTASILSLTPNATGTPTLTYAWTSSNTGVATVNSTGNVTGVSAGSTNIRYTVIDGSSTSCSAQSATHSVTVNALPIAGAITGGSAVCMGGSLSLTSHATGTPTLIYTWASSNPAVATVNNSGVVTSVSAGTTNITYTVIDGSSTACQAISPAFTVNVNALPVAGAITGGSTVCMGGSLSLTSHATGTPTLTYAWASSNPAVATVNNSGVVTPVSLGSTNITYTVTDGSTTTCSATSPNYAVTVNVLPVAGAITGGSAVCMGGSLSLTSHATGTPTLTYTWASSNPAVATVNNSGVVTPVSAGTTNITYIVTDGSASLCAATSPTYAVTVNALPIAGAITGGSAVCLGGSLSLISHATGTPTLTCTWASSNPAVATVNNSGVVTPVSAGTTNITYTVTDGSTTACSATSPILAVTVNALPAVNLVIGGSGAICSGTSTNITVALSEINTNYQLRNATGNVNVGAPVAGTGGTINLATGTLTSATTFNILATNIITNCSAVLTATEVVTVDPPSAGGTLTGGTSPITYGGSTGNISLSGHTGTVVNWQKMVGSGSWADITNTTTTFTESPASTGTWQYRAQVKSGACPTVFSNSSSISVLPKTLTITSNNQTKAYGTVFTFVGTEYTVTGLINSDAVTSATFISTGSPAAASVLGSPYTITPSAAIGTGLGNYTIGYTNGSFLVTKAILTVIADTKSKIYGTANPVLTFTYSGWKNGEGESVLTTKPVASTTVNLTTSAGVYAGAITVAGGLGDNYDFTYTAADFTITKANQTITFSALPVKTYGDGDFAVSAVASSGLSVSYSSDNPAVATILSGKIHIVGAGTAVITASQSGNGNYNPSPAVPQTLTVSKTNLTFTADSKSRAYLAQNPVLTYSISGYVYTESQSVLDVLPGIQTTAVQNSPVGSYPITISGGSDNNYNYLYVPGTLSISKISQIITFTGVPEKLLVADTYTLVATSTSGLTVLFESMDTELATVSGDQLTGVSKGNVQIRASNTGNQNYNAAEAFATVEIYSTHKDIMHLFTPNNDGINDYWELPEFATWGKCDVKVYNRWGKLVFADTNYNNLWDGTSNGAPLPEGPYYFVIKTENAGTVKGTVNIVR